MIFNFDINLFMFFDGMVYYYFFFVISDIKFLIEKKKGIEIIFRSKLWPSHILEFWHRGIFYIYLLFSLIINIYRLFHSGHCRHIIEICFRIVKLFYNLLTMIGTNIRFIVVSFFILINNFISFSPLIKQTTKPTKLPRLF